MRGACLDLAPSRSGRDIAAEVLMRRVPCVCAIIFFSLSMWPGSTGLVDRESRLFPSAGLESAAAALPAANKSVAIVGATIIDGTGRAPIPAGVIVIQGDTIEFVGRRDDIGVPPDARVVDAAGKFIIPGMMDSNVHLVIQRTVEFLARYENRLEELIEEAAQVALKNGQTTVFDTWGPLQPLLNVRDKIDRGEVPGSRIFIAGNCIGMSGPLGVDMNAEGGKTASAAFVKRINSIWEENVGPDLAYMTPDQVRSEVRKYVSRGMDFLKYASSGHTQPRLIVFSEEAQKAIVEEGHRAGLTVQAHTTSNESLRLAIGAGVDLVTHADDTGPMAVSETNLAILKDRRIPCGIIPKTTRRWELEIGRNPGTPGAPADPRMLKFRRSNQLLLIEAGVPLLLNTDGGLWHRDHLAQFPSEHWLDFGAVIGEGYLRSCRAMVDSGVSPMDVILSGTRNIAAAYKKLGELGTLESGKLADLVILDGDPLADIGNVRKIHAVMKDGQIVDREKLPLKKILYPGF